MKKTTARKQMKAVRQPKFYKFKEKDINDLYIIIETLAGDAEYLHEAVLSNDDDLSAGAHFTAMREHSKVLEKRLAKIKYHTPK